MRPYLRVVVESERAVASRRLLEIVTWFQAEPMSLSSVEELCAEVRAIARRLDPDRKP